MYLDYFSLERHPFRITPDTSLFYYGGDRGRGVVLEAMLYAIQNGEGILKVVGEVGSGKTMLCRMLEQRLPATTEVVYLANPKLSPEEILYAVAFELKLPVRHETPRLLVMQQLQNYLLQQHAANKRVLVTIEEAQSMPYETLEEIRLLSNLETSRDKLMQIILFGQPELDKILAAKHIRQLRERITHSFYLQPLSRRDVADYLRFRIGAAGCPCPQLISAAAEKLIAKASGGLTRRINILADKALLAAYTDNVLRYRRQVTPGMAPLIKRKHVLAAIGDSDYKIGLLTRFLTPLRVAGASTLFGIGLVGLQFGAEVERLFQELKEHNALSSLLAGYQSSAPNKAAQLPLAVSANGTRLAITRPHPENVIRARPLLEIPQLMRLDVLPEAESEPSELPSEPLAQAPVAAEALAVDPVASGAEDDTPMADEPAPDDIQPDAALSEQQEQVSVDPAPGDSTLATLTTQNPTLQDQSPELKSPLEKLLSLGPVIPAYATLTRSRIPASNAWTQESDRGRFTVQFVTDGMENLDYAETIFQVLDRADLLQQAYLCLFKGQEQTFWTIKYGSFDSLNEAQTFLSEMPSSLRDFSPFVQNISDVVCNNNPQTIAATVE